MEEAHRALTISPAIFDEVATELGRSLDHFNVPAREKEEVLAAFAAHTGEVTEGYTHPVATAQGGGTERGSRLFQPQSRLGGLRRRLVRTGKAARANAS